MAVLKKAYSLEEIVRVMKERGYEVTERSNEPNIVGIRIEEPLDEFNDTLVVFWRTDSGEWEMRQYRFTTDAGRRYFVGEGYMEANPRGVAVLAEGQYKDAYAVGLHKRGRRARLQTLAYRILQPFLREGKYLGRKNISHWNKTHEALVQAEDVAVYRDANGDARIDEDPRTKETGRYDINIHRGIPGDPELVDTASAGCQVFAYEKDWKEFMDLIKRRLKSRNGRYTYTLLHDADFSMKKVA